MMIQGKVIQGVQQAGQTFGVETANLDVTFTEQEGIFAAKTYYDGKIIPSIAFLGTAHLVEGKPWRCEVHLLEGKYDLYGKELTIELVQKLRDSIEFTSEEQAKEQIDKDLQQAKEVLEQ